MNAPAPPSSYSRGNTAPSQPTSGPSDAEVPLNRISRHPIHISADSPRSTATNIYPCPPPAATSNVVMGVPRRSIVPVLDLTACGNQASQIQPPYPSADLIDFQSGFQGPPVVPTGFQGQRPVVPTSTDTDEPINVVDDDDDLVQSFALERREEQQRHLDKLEEEHTEQARMELERALLLQQQQRSKQKSS